ncbi:MAG: pilus assembly protein PilM [Candidatus Paceibacterota bacterium]
MFRNFFKRFFPTPKFLVLPSFGLDISDESIKFVELIKTGNSIKVNRYGEKKIPSGIIESGKIKDPKKMEEILISLRNEEGLKSVRVSLPEEQVYLFNLKLEKLGLENVREAIELSLEEYIPISAQDTIFDYELLSEDEQSLKLQVAAIPKNVIEEYLSIFKNSKISAKSFELEAQAIVRAVIKKGDLETYMIVDFGKKRTGIFIVSGGIVIFTSTLDMGGVMLTNIIEKNLKISFEEAEKKKKECGLKRDASNPEVSTILLNGVSVLRDEIVKHFLYWHTHKDEEGKDRPPIKKIILCGGDSNLIGLSEYFSVSTKTRVEMADVWINIGDTGKYIPEINFNQSLAFATTLGLALRDFEHD